MIKTEFEVLRDIQKIILMVVVLIALFEAMLFKTMNITGLIVIYAIMTVTTTTFMIILMIFYSQER